MSLYRTYRPKTFPDVAGQDHIVSTLEQAVKQDKLAHAYLFAGSRGTGKTSIARILARELLTRGVLDEKLRSQILKGVDDGSLVDLTEIDAASNTGVDNIRDLIEKIQFSPLVAGAKVYIIDEAHMLSKGAFNALLKTLEEPPPYAYFVLATTELHKVPATIQSRCQRYLFRQIREEDIIRRLQFVADQERITIDRAALRAIAHHAQGSLRDAISLLDQLRSLESITADDVRHRIGETGHEYVEQMTEALRVRDRQIVLDLTRRMEETGVPLENFVRLLLGSVRADLETAITEKRDITALLTMLDTLLSAIRDLRIAPVPGLVLESSLLSLCQDETATTAPAKRKETPSKAPPPPIPPSVAAEKNAPAATAAKPPHIEPTDAPTEAPPLTFGQLQAVWNDIVRSLEPAGVRISLKNGHLSNLEGSTVLVSFTSAFHRDKVGAVEAARAVESALERVFKKPLRLKCILETGEHAHAPADKEVVNLAEAAAEIF